MIAVRNLAVTKGDFSLREISFEIEQGRYGILMGKTASGKTTILEAICGLNRINGGRIQLDGRDVTGLKPAERGIGYVPQDGALFPTMSVRDNLGFGLLIRGRPKEEIEIRTSELAGQLGISDLLDRKPVGLSGGETQRIALGRALAARPNVLLLDEPLSALDDETRREMRDLLKSVQRQTGVTTLHITHSLSEAADLADVLLRLDEGQVSREENPKR